MHRKKGKVCSGGRKGPRVTSLNKGGGKSSSTHGPEEIFQKQLGKISSPSREGEKGGPIVLGVVLFL